MTFCRSNFYTDSGRFQRFGDCEVRCGLGQHAREIDHAFLDAEGVALLRWRWAPAATDPAAESRNADGTHNAGCAAHDGAHPWTGCPDRPVTPDDDDDEAVHQWFELSYSTYQVLPRTLMQSMPAEWQRRMVACLEELRDAFAHVEQAPGYQVTACRWQLPHDTDDYTLRGLGFWWDHGPTGRRTYYNRDGDEVDAMRACVPVPVTDPVPHYNRGRTRITPRVDAPGTPTTTEDTL